MAVAQAQRVCDLLQSHHPELTEPDCIEMVKIVTTGDRVQDRTLAEIGGKELFAKEIEEALLAGEIDLAVHSLKDVATVLPAGLCLACVLERDDPRDAWLSRDRLSLSDLPDGSIVGTASLRRRAQILNLRPGLEARPLRGNANTRMRKLHLGDVDATLLAISGLRRIGSAHVATEILSPEILLPAVGQGAIVAECREDDDGTRHYLEPLNHLPSQLATDAERALLEALDGSCHTPIAALAEIGDDGAMRLRGLVAQPDGARIWRVERQGGADEAAMLGRDAGEELVRTIGPAFDSLRASN
jgi:hydroxymethylbilane synthase